MFETTLEPVPAQRAVYTAVALPSLADLESGEVSLVPILQAKRLYENLYFMNESWLSSHKLCISK